MSWTALGVCFAIVAAVFTMDSHFATQRKFLVQKLDVTCSQNLKSSQNTRMRIKYTVRICQKMALEDDLIRSTSSG